MCTKIDCEYVVVSYFNGSNQNELTFKDLNIIRREIEKNNESFFVDVSYSAIRKTAIKFQDYIEIEHNRIHLIDESLRQFKSESLTVDCVEIINHRIMANSQL